MDDPLYAVSGRVFSEISVCGFFVISGYLIHQSLERSRTVWSFLRKRLTRIFPGLIVAVIFVALIIGVLITTLTTTQYLGNKGTWLYIANNILLIPRQPTLPGVFEHNPETAVNGSLWTLRYEVLFYILLCLLFSASGQAKKWLLSISFLLCTIGYFLLKHEVVVLPGGIHKFIFFVFNLGSYFSAGALLSLFPKWLQQWKAILLPVSAVLFLCSLLFWQQQLEVVGIISFSALIITFGLYYFPVLHYSRLTGDISYGTYIYAYPIQQALLVWLTPQHAVQLMLPSFVLAWIFGWLSWHLVEKHFLKKRAQTYTII